MRTIQSSQTSGCVCVGDAHEKEREPRTPTTQSLVERCTALRMRLVNVYGVIHTFTEKCVELRGVRRKR